MFLQNMEIVPIVNISNNEKDNVKKLFESSSYFSGFEPTRNKSEGTYLLVTNKSVLNKTQNEVDNLLQIFCGKRQVTPNKHLPERQKRSLMHNQVSSYAAVLSQKKFPNSSPINDLLSSFTQTTSIHLLHSRTNQDQQRHGHYPHPTFLPHLTFILLRHFLHREPRNVKFKPKHHPSSPQLKIIPPIINRPPYRGKMN